VPETSALRVRADQSPMPRTPAESAVEADLRIQERHKVIQLQLISRNGKSERLAAEIAKFLGREAPLTPLAGAERDGLSIFATGPREYWVLADGDLAAKAMIALQEAVTESASVFNQSDSRHVFMLSGRHVLDVLAKGSPLDLCAQAFPRPGAAHSVIVHIPVLIVRCLEPDACEVLVPRSYAASFVAWLKEAALEQRPTVRG